MVTLTNQTLRRVTRRKLERPGTTKQQNKTRSTYNQPKRPSIGTTHKPSTGHHRKSSPGVKSHPPAQQPPASITQTQQDRRQRPLSQRSPVCVEGGPSRTTTAGPRERQLPPWLVVPVLRSCQSPIWIWLVNYLHLHLQHRRHPQQRGHATPPSRGALHQEELVDSHGRTASLHGGGLGREGRGKGRDERAGGRATERGWGGA